MKDKRKYWRQARGRCWGEFQYQGTEIKIRADFLKTMQAWRQWSDIFKILKESIF